MGEATDLGSFALDDSRRIMEERARSLARPLRSDTTAEAGERLLMMRVGQDQYAIDITRVKEVTPRRGLAPIPGAPPMWAGLANIRGSIVPVLSLGRYLGLPDGDDDAAGMIVVVTGGGITLGVLVDDTSEVRVIVGGDLVPALAGAIPDRQQVVRGITRDLLSLLDVDAMLADPGLAVHQDG
jgi:purine-binding chemotaxis protein CheW